MADLQGYLAWKQRQSQGSTAPEIQATTPEPTEDNPLEWSDVPKEALMNVIPSGVDLLKSVGQAIAHPIQTVEGIEEITAGGVSKLLPEKYKNKESEQKFEALINFFKDRYGGEEELKKTMATDPIGFLTDIASVASLGETAAAKIPGLSKAAAGLGKVSEFADPMRVAGKIGEKGVTAAIGKTTNTGTLYAEEALKNTKEFREAKRGRIPETEIRENTLDAIGNVEKKMGQDYSERLARLKKSDQSIDMSTLKQKTQELINDPTVVLPSDADAKIVDLIYNDIMNWQDTTPAGMDILKRRISKYTMALKRSGGPSHIPTQLSKAIKAEIMQKVPEYGQMMKNYERSVNFIEDIQKTFSLGDKSSTVSGINKLTRALRNDKEFAQRMLAELEKQSGVNLKAQIAGYGMKPWASRGVMANMPTLATAGMAGYFAGLGPGVAAILASSPRLMANLLQSLGLIKKLPSDTGKALFQAGRIQGQQEGE